jgi:two-component system chemotaxis response regulator CheB
MKAIVGLGASAGGLHAVSMVIAALPRDLCAPVLLVQHVDPRHPSLLPGILARATQLIVKPAEAGEVLCLGTLYVAPPGRHLLVGRDFKVLLADTDLVNWVRPSADRLFISLAEAVGSAAIAVVLTGTGHDGGQGAAAVKRAGGRLIVQDPADAEYPSMPEAALAATPADYVLPLAEIGPMVGRLVSELT